MRRSLVALAAMALAGAGFDVVGSRTNLSSSFGFGYSFAWDPIFAVDELRSQTKSKDFRLTSVQTRRKHLARFHEAKAAKRKPKHMKGKRPA